MTWGQILINMAKTIGISDLLIEECPWIKDWMRRHRDNLRRSDLSYHWYWVD